MRVSPVWVGGQAATSLYKMGDCQSSRPISLDYGLYLPAFAVMQRGFRRVTLPPRIGESGTLELLKIQIKLDKFTMFFGKFTY